MGNGSRDGDSKAARSPEAGSSRTRPGAKSALTKPLANHCSVAVSPWHGTGKIAGGAGAERGSAGSIRPVAIVPTTESEPGRAVPAHDIRSPARSANRLPGTVCPLGQESTGDSRVCVLTASRPTCSKLVKF
jgi:hypothetical protein